jgi:5-methylcytosine-specific restriction protein A
MVRYVGCFACSSWSDWEAKDRRGNARQAIVFHLVPVEEEPAVTQEPAPAAPPNQPLGELRKKAFASATEAPQSNPKEAKRLHYERSEAVRVYVLGRANRICEACERPAPFLRPDGSAYLEPHHTRRVSDGGPDHPRWVGAVCPNCHRQIHYGADGLLLNRALQDRLGKLEGEA